MKSEEGTSERACAGRGRHGVGLTPEEDVILDEDDVDLDDQMPADLWF